MKLQVFILTLGIVASAGAVEVQLNRSAVGAASSQVISTPIAASKPVTALQTSPKQSSNSSPITVSEPSPARPTTTASTGLLSSAKPLITGIAASEENDD